MTELGNCVLPHRPVNGRPGAKRAAVGLLCDHHFAGLRETLADVVELFAMSRLYLLPGSVVSDGSKHTKAAEAPAPIRLDIVALSDRRNPASVAVTALANWDESKGRLCSNGSDIPDVAGVLEDWAGWVVEERRLPALKKGWTIADSTRLLKDNLSWIAGHEMVTDYHDTLRMLRSVVAAATGEQRDPVGKCPSDFAGALCDGPLWMVGNEFAVECGKCGRHYPEEMLRHLGGMMETSDPSGKISA